MIGPHVVLDVARERVRQDRLVDDGKIPFNCSDPDVDDGRKIAVLTEEFLEVVKAVNDGESDERLREELIQLAACAVAHAESIDTRCARRAA